MAQEKTPIDKEYLIASLKSFDENILSKKYGGNHNDGFSPIVSVEEVDGGYKVSITDATHTEEFTILHGSGDGQNTVGIALGTPYDITITNQDESVLLQWTDPSDLAIDGVNIAEWAGTVVVRKAGSAPTSKTDGTIVIDSKIRDQYKDVGFQDNNLTNGVTYYYGIFPYTKQNTYTTTTTMDITPEIISPPEVTDVEVVQGANKLTITFNKDITVTRVKCVYKEGSIPENNTDGIVIDNFTSGSTITGLTSGTTYYFRLYSYNNKNRETASNGYIGTESSVQIATFADATDEQISALLDAHYNNELNLSDIWSVGDKRTISLNGTDYTFVIIDFEHDTLETPINDKTTAALTLHMVNLLNTKYRMNSTRTNVNGWSATELRTTMNSTMIDWFPNGLKDLIKPVTKKYGIGNEKTTVKTVNDKLWLLAATEIRASTETDSSHVKEGTQYSYYATQSHRLKKINGKNANWWTRSPYYDGATSFLYQDTSASVITHNIAENPNGVAIALCL